jgi:hypothetical protein
MEIQTSELIGQPLDWAVAKAENFYVDGFAIIRLWNNRVTKIIPGDYETGEVYTSYAPSSKWEQGGPIIDREKISVMEDVPAMRESIWKAKPSITAKGAGGRWGSGPTALIAAMRCFVASKLGPFVDVPDELISSAPALGPTDSVERRHKHRP